MTHLRFPMLHNLHARWCPPRRYPLRTGLIALILSLSLVTASCGIPTQNTPTTIAKRAVPFHLLDPNSTTTTTTTPSPGVTVSQPIYLVASNQHVAPVVRNVPLPANLTQILGALIEGPTASETAAGLQSFLVGTPSDVHAITFDGIVTVDFATNPVQVVGPDQILAIAQIVFTAMAQPGITGVTFEIDGTAIEVPTAGGEQVPGPVNDATYVPQAPVPPTAASTPTTSMRTAAPTATG